MQLILNQDHLTGVLQEAFSRCRHRLLIATANLKAVYMPNDDKRGRGASILDAFEKLSKRNVEIRLLHSGIPSGPFIAALKENFPPNLEMRRCPRVHAKAVVVDGTLMYLGSANLTGAGLGAKSEKRRNFEAGIWTEDVSLIDPVVDMLDEIWNGQKCETCGRREHCPVPLEEPQL